MTRGDDKHIRSSVAVSDVLGNMDADQLGQVVKEKCGAGLLRVDASSTFFPEPSPRGGVIRTSPADEADPCSGKFRDRGRYAAQGDPS